MVLNCNRPQIYLGPKSLHFTEAGEKNPAEVWEWTAFRKTVPVVTHQESISLTPGPCVLGKIVHHGDHTPISCSSSKFQRKKYNQSPSHHYF